MWLSTNHILPKQKRFLVIVGKALFLCQRFEQMFTRLSVGAEQEKLFVTRQKKLQKKLKEEEYEDVSKMLERAWENHSKKPLGKRIDALQNFLDQDGMDAEDKSELEDLKQIFKKARIARNYIAHSSIPFCEGIGYPSHTKDDLADLIDEELTKLKAAVFDVLCAEECLNRQEWSRNNKDSYPSHYAVRYKENVMRWVFS